MFNMFIIAIKGAPVPILLFLKLKRNFSMTLYFRLEGGCLLDLFDKEMPGNEITRAVPVCKKSKALTEVFNRSEFVLDDLLLLESYGFEIKIDQGYDEGFEPLKDAKNIIKKRLFGDESVLNELFKRMGFGRR